MKNLSLAMLVFFLGCTFQQEGVPEPIRGMENLIVLSEEAGPRASIELVREAALEAPGEIALNWYEDVPEHSWLAGVEVDDSGRVFVADLWALKIHVFGPDGSYLTSLGGEGSGPGEYYTISDTEMVSNRLHVFDFMQFRTTIYALDPLRVLEVQDVRPPVNKDEFVEIAEWLGKPPVIRSDGTYLAGFMKDWPNHNFGRPGYNLDRDRPIKYYFMDRESRIISDEIFELKKAKEYLTAHVGDRFLSNIAPFPFLGKSLITVSDDNHIYTTWTEDFLIKVYAPDGDYLRALYHPLQKRPLVREEIISLFDENDKSKRELVRHAELLETWPAIHSILTDDENRLWVAANVAEEGVREWWVLQATGELVAKFTWPRNRSVEALKDGYAYALETDPATGQQKIVKYRIEMN